jgi:hypothetical protein
LAAERERLDATRNALEQERKSIVAERRTESILLPLLQSLGGLILLVCVLGFCWRAIFLAQTEPVTDLELSQLLLDELKAPDSPAALGVSSRAQIPHQSARST